MSEGGQAFQLAQLELMRVIFGVDSPTPLWEQCVNKAQNSIGFAAGALYIKNYFSHDNKREVNNMKLCVVKTYRTNSK